MSVIIDIIGIDNEALRILVVLILADYISGLVKAYLCEEISSRIGIRGIIKKVMLLLALVVGHHLDLFFCYDGTIRLLILSMLIVNEAISCLENLEAIGFPLPPKLKKVLQQCRKN